MVIFLLLLGGPLQMSFGMPVMLSQPFAQAPSMQGYKMTASGNNVYFIWTVNTPGHGTQLFFRKSADSGKTFENQIQLANSTNIDKPIISAADNNVYVTWSQQVNNLSTLMVRQSTDGGTAFRDPVSISIGNASQSSLADMKVSGNIVQVFWTGFFGPNRTQSIVLSQSTDGGSTFRDPVYLSDPSISSSQPVVAQSGSNTYVAWGSENSCLAPLGNCNLMHFIRTIDSGTVGTAVHLDSLDGIFPIEIVAQSNTLLVEGLKRAYNDAVFENSTILISQSNDGGNSFSTTTLTYDVNMGQIYPVLAGSMLYQFWTVYENGLQPQPVFVARSSDGGKTFDTPTNMSGNTTPLVTELGSQTASSGNTAYVVWYGTDTAGANHVFFESVTPDSLGTIKTVENLWQAGRFQIAPSGSEVYLSFQSGQSLFFETVDNTSYAETGLSCPVNSNPQAGSVILDKPDLLVDGEQATSILAGWSVAVSSSIHDTQKENDKVIYQVEAIKDGAVTWQSEENFTATCGDSSKDVINWSTQSAGNYTIQTSLLNPSNPTEIISSSNRTVQISENNESRAFPTPVQFKLLNDTAKVVQGGFTKFTVEAGPISQNYRLHNISLWIDTPTGIEAWFDKYSIFSYDYKLENLTMYVYAGSAANPGINSLKIEGKGVAANLVSGTVFNVGNPMPPAGPPRFPAEISSLHENGQQIGAINITINSPSKPSAHVTVGKPDVHYVNLCSTRSGTHGGGGTCMGFVGYEEFPLMVYSDMTGTVNLSASNLPNGAWIKFLPQQVVATPEGTPAKLVLAGALEPFEINVLDVKVAHIYANSTQGSSIAYLPLGNNGEKVQVLNGTAPMEFGSPIVNINSTTPSPFGIVYDSNPTTNSLSVLLSVLGVEQNNKTVPMPSWLSVDFVPSSFTLNASQPFYLKMETSTITPPSGSNATVVVGEQIGGKIYTGHIQIKVPPAVYFGAGGGLRLAPAMTGGSSDSLDPLKQFMKGIPLEQIKCNSGLDLVEKKDGHAPACVKPDTVNILIERGWAMQLNNSSPGSMISQHLQIAREGIAHARP